MVVMSHLTRLRIAGIGTNSLIVAQLMVEGDIKHLMTIAIPLVLEDGTKCAMTSSATMELAMEIGNSHQTWITAKVAMTNNQGFPTRTSTTILKGKPHHRSIGKSQYVGSSPLQVVQLRGTNARIRIGSTIVSSNLPRPKIGATCTPRLQGITERMRTALYASTEKDQRTPSCRRTLLLYFLSKKASRWPGLFSPTPGNMEGELQKHTFFLQEGTLLFDGGRLVITFLPRINFFRIYTLLFFYEYLFHQSFYIFYISR